MLNAAAAYWGSCQWIKKKSLNSREELASLITSNVTVPIQKVSARGYCTCLINARDYLVRPFVTHSGQSDASRKPASRLWRKQPLPLVSHSPDSPHQLVSVAANLVGQNRHRHCCSLLYQFCFQVTFCSFCLSSPSDLTTLHSPTPPPCLPMQGDTSMHLMKWSVAPESLCHSKCVRFF